jgi:hypothetical protein
MYAVLTSEAPPTDEIWAELADTASLLRTGTARAMSWVENRVGAQKLAVALVITELERVTVTATQFWLPGTMKLMVCPVNVPETPADVECVGLGLGEGDCVGVGVTEWVGLGLGEGDCVGVGVTECPGVCDGDGLGECVGGRVGEGVTAGATLGRLEGCRVGVGVALGVGWVFGVGERRDGVGVADGH